MTTRLRNQTDMVIDIPTTHLFDTHVTPTNTHISAHVKCKILKQTGRGGFQMNPLFAPWLGSQTDKSLGESPPYVVGILL